MALDSMGHCFSGKKTGKKIQFACLFFLVDNMQFLV